MRPALVCLIVVAASLAGVASAGQASDQAPCAELTARLTPAEVLRAPAGMRPGARGTFRASFCPYRKYWDSVRYWLYTAQLTGRPWEAHIHTGAPGRSGPVLITLCTDGRCYLSGAGFRAMVTGTVTTLEVLGGYVDVHTKRNPRGELRGQIAITP